MNPPDVVQLNRETLSLENYASAVVTSNLARSINLAMVEEKNMLLIKFKQTYMTFPKSNVDFLFFFPLFKTWTSPP